MENVILSTPTKFTDNSLQTQEKTLFSCYYVYRSRQLTIQSDWILMLTGLHQAPAIISFQIEKGKFMLTL